jgi:hypothetical protein
MADFEKIAKELQEVNEQGLSRVSKLANMQLHMEERIDLLEKELKEAKTELRAVAEDQLPAAMAEHNISELKLEDGSTISVSKFYSASIPKDRQEEAFGWLVTNNFGDLIKNQVATNFVRGQEAEAEKFASELSERGLPVNTKKWVEPMTLKAFIRDQVEKGNPIPMDTFGIYIGEKAKITKQKR